MLGLRILDGAPLTKPPTSSSSVEIDTVHPLPNDDAACAYITELYGDEEAGESHGHGRSIIISLIFRP